MRLEAAESKRGMQALTPLIDVVFLLLLFFMLASTFDRFASVEVRLAGDGAGPSSVPARAMSVLLSVRDGPVFAIDGRAVAREAIAPGLRALAGRSEARVIVRASAGAVAQDIVAAVEAAQAAGIGPVLLVH